MIVTMVPQKEIQNEWQRVEPLIAKAVKHAAGRTHVADIFADLLTGDQTLWIAVDKTVVRGCCTVRIVEYPEFRACRLENLAGNDIDEWIWEGMMFIREYAHDMECDRFEMDGRTGWERVLSKHGFKKYKISMELIFDEENS